MPEKVEESKPAEETTKKAKVVELMAEVTDSIKGAGETIRTRLREAMVEREIKERVDLLDKTIIARNSVLTELRKIERPDVETFGADGKVVSASYTKARLEELKKLKDKIAKYENAIEKALTDNDFSKLKELGK